MTLNEIEKDEDTTTRLRQRWCDNIRILPTVLLEVAYIERSHSSFKKGQLHCIELNWPTANVTKSHKKCQYAKNGISFEVTAFLFYMLNRLLVNYGTLNSNGRFGMPKYMHTKDIWKPNIVIVPPVQSSPKWRLFITSFPQPVFATVMQWITSRTSLCKYSYFIKLRW